MLILDILGLLMNFVGAILLYLSGVAGVAGADDAPKEVKGRREFRAGIGVGLLIIGFFLQLVGHTVTGLEELFAPSPD